MSYTAAFGSLEVSLQDEALEWNLLVLWKLASRRKLWDECLFVFSRRCGHHAGGGGRQKSKDNGCIVLWTPPYFWFEKRNRNLGYWVFIRNSWGRAEQDYLVSNCSHTAGYTLRIFPPVHHQNAQKRWTRKPLKTGNLCCWLLNRRNLSKFLMVAGTLTSTWEQRTLCLHSREPMCLVQLFLTIHGKLDFEPWCNFSYL